MIQLSKPESYDYDKLIETLEQLAKGEKVTTSYYDNKEKKMKERVVELINQIGNSLDSPTYAEKILTECGKEILQIVGNLEEQIEILKRK